MKIPSCVCTVPFTGLDNYVVEYTVSLDEKVTPDKVGAWANSYPDLESEDSADANPSHIYDEVKEDLTSTFTEDFNSSVPAGYSVPTHALRHSNSVSEALRALSLRRETSSARSTLERDVSPPPDYRNLPPGPLQSAFSGSGEGLLRQPHVENAYDHPPMRFMRAEL